MQIIPVLDLLGGLVVRGIAGKRDEYRPIQSRIVFQPDPLHVAAAFRDLFGLTSLYVADLDAILHGRPNRSIYEELTRAGFQLLVDAGIRDLSAARDVLSSGATAVVAGLETLPGPELLADLCSILGPDRTIFSLDLKAGRPLGNTIPWRSDDPFEIAQRAFDAGTSRMIVLDLAGVGIGAGVPTDDFCRRLVAEFPELHLITGGGVRDVTDLVRLQSLGLHGLLVASALHDARITPADIRRFSDTLRNS